MPWDFWLIFLILGVFVPWRGRARLRKLLERPAIDTVERLTLYAATIAVQWFLVAVVAWRSLARGLTATELGLTGYHTWQIAIISATGAIILGGLQWLNLRRVGKMEGPAPDLMRKLASRILPRSLVELLPFFALAVTAGMCEEFLYRGFAMAALSRSGLAPWMVVPITAVLFGLAHAYQGRGGIVATAALGVVFGVARITCDNLAPVMAWHTAVDLVAGIAGPKYLLGKQESSQDIKNQ